MREEAAANVPWRAGIGFGRRWEKKGAVQGEKKRLIKIKLMSLLF